MSPYLSIVVPVGGVVTDDVIERLAASTTNKIELADKFGLSMELIIVEWNMPASCRTLAELLTVRSAQNPIRIIHVPAELHAKAYNPHGLDFFTKYPKNIGIHRAHGEFVLSTGLDALYTEDLVAYLAKRELQHGYFYRVNRHDTRAGKVYVIHYETGSFSQDAEEPEIRSGRFPDAAPWSPGMIHYNASGDFTLMARDDWFMIHGNPEREYNRSVDGQTLWLAHLKGMKQIVLPYPIFHPDHSRSLNCAHIGGPIFGPGWSDREPFTKENGEDWGHAEIEFPETVLRW
jgi:hypothetical protein